MDIEKYIMLKHKIGEKLLVRYLYTPFIKLREFYVSHILYSKSDREKIKNLENRYAGKRCFVVGNGPSLTAEDLGLIKGEISFACNRIYHIFHETSWRPDFYVCVDPIQLKENRKEILGLQEAIKFISCRSDLEDEKTIKINDQREYIINPYKAYNVRFSDAADRRLYTHSTVLYVVLQIAIYMGFTEVVLLGVDHNFKTMTNEKNIVVVNETVEKNHFAAQKESDQNIVFDTNGANRDYWAAKVIAEKRKIKIINATRGGCLEIFQRRRLEEILKE